MTTELQNFISEKLKEIFSLEGKEWAEVYITPLNRIDITIVSNKADSIEENAVSSEVSKLIHTFNNSANVSASIAYTIGFIEIYTIEDAEDFGIHHMEIKREPITWSDVININKQKVEREKRTGLYKVINFYSYKGGVGRTIALIQVAYLLAKQGKRVLLVDLDIEAPSLHRIFKKQVNDETFGVTYGLVDYLFEKTMSVNKRDQKIKTRELFCEISFDESISGSMYVIPATKQLDSQYIFKLSQLQTHIIYENKYLEDLLGNLEKDLNVDTVLIDSRTGINQWGAFSLLGFSDQIVFVTYPNEENIEGVNQVIKLMDEAGLENYVVAMSKIVTSADGQKYSDSLFEKLNVNQMMPINIPYNSAIAMTDAFPAKDITEPYKELSDFIIENDNIDFNISYLNRADRQHLTKNIFYDFNDSTVIDTDSEAKVLKDNNYNVVIYNSQSELKKIHKNSEYFQEISERIHISDEQGRTLFYPQRSIPIWYTSEQSELANCLKNNNSSWDLKWLAFILYEINQYKSIEKNSKLLNGCDELQGKDFEAYCNYLEQYIKDEILGIITFAILFEARDYYDINEENIKKQHPKKIINQNVSVFIDISLLFNQYSGEEWLISLISIIKLFKKNIPSLRIVAAVSSELYYGRYEKLFSDLKGSIIRLEWNESDIKRLLISNINRDVFKDYFDEYSVRRRFLNEYSTINLISHIVSEETNKQYEYNILSELLPIDLIIGTRTICGKYSEKMLSWLTKKLKKELPFISSEIVINIMRNAADIEIQSNNKDTQDRLISVKSIEKAINRYLAGLS